MLELSAVEEQQWCGRNIQSSGSGCYPHPLCCFWLFSAFSSVICTKTAPSGCDVISTEVCCLQTHSLGQLTNKCTRGQKSRLGMMWVKSCLISLKMRLQLPEKQLGFVEGQNVTLSLWTQRQQEMLPKELIWLSETFHESLLIHPSLQLGRALQKLKHFDSWNILTCLHENASIFSFKSYVKFFKVTPVLLQKILEIPFWKDTK